MKKTTDNLYYGNVKTATQTFDSGNMFVRDYDRNGDLISNDIFRIVNEVITRDEENRMIYHKITRQYIDKTETNRYHYIYDNKGHLIETVSFIQDHVSRFLYTYEGNNVVKEQFFDNDELRSVETYEYDDQNRLLITKNEYDNKTEVYKYSYLTGFHDGVVCTERNVYVNDVHVACSKEYFKDGFITRVTEIEYDEDNEEMVATIGNRFYLDIDEHGNGTRVKTDFTVFENGTVTETEEVYSTIEFEYYD